MPRALAIDDDPIVLKLTAATLTRLGYEVSTASDGVKGLVAVKTDHPDVIISDVMMPGMNGYEVTRRLRRDPEFAQTPILILTGQSELEEKLQAFEAGADDFMNKPFEPAELAARLTVLLRRSEAGKLAQSLGLTRTEEAQLVAVHSLRGGIGSSSLATNLSIGLAQLWETPTLLLDLVFSAGQIALMLDTPLKRTWGDLAGFSLDDMDFETLHTIIGQHASGLDFIAAPTLPTEAEELANEVLRAAIKLLKTHYDYVIADTAHDFSETTLTLLDAADVILVPLAPEMSSVRAAAAALDTYTRLGYSKDKIKLVLNWTFEHHGLPRKNIEAALHMPVTLVLPFASDTFVGAINRGRPLLYESPTDPIATLIEDFAFRLSKERHRAIPPAVPSAAWLRVNKRLAVLSAELRK
ncbi:MAG: response regulator [Chloroflexi bacterium]|nr:response regulator [Chloroflexota bacterium]